MQTYKEYLAQFEAKLERQGFRKTGDSGEIYMSYEDELARLRQAYGKGKARFYADPRFAGTVGLVVGLVVGWFIF